jgi:gluconokinase
MGQIDSFVVTGGALLANPGWIQILADVLGRTLEVSGVAEGSARGAAVLELERLGLPVPEAPISHLVEPRPDRHEIHLQARAEQRALIQTREAS